MLNNIVIKPRYRNNNIFSLALVFVVTKNKNKNPTRLKTLYKTKLRKYTRFMFSNSEKRIVIKLISSISILCRIVRFDKILNKKDMAMARNPMEKNL